MFTALDLASKILSSAAARRVLSAVGRAALRSAARELTRKAFSGETNPASRRWKSSRKPRERS
jgi:hypothetical protein